MAQIVFGAALSHSPLMNYPIAPEYCDRVDAFRQSARVLGRRIRDAGADTLIVFGQDHFRALFYDNMPAFLVGMGEVRREGDWNGSVGELVNHVGLARHIVRSVYDDGFEPSLSYDISVDHGITQATELAELLDLRIVPILINAAAPPLPTPARCYQFGVAIRRAISSFEPDCRVALLGSGGLSHQPAPSNVESQAAEDAAGVEYLIHGRDKGAAREPDRIRMFQSSLDRLAAFIRPDWDRRMLDRIASGDAAALSRELNFDNILAEAGSGGQEIRSWLAMLGALGAAKLQVVHYDPIPALITGMGMIAAEVPAPAARDTERRI